MGIILNLLVCAIMVSVTFTRAAKIVDVEGVQKHCGYTRYPSVCIETLGELGSSSQNDQETDVLSTLINKTISETIFPDSDFEKFSSNSNTSSEATDYCHDLMEMSQARLKQALEALRESPRKNKEDIQTWLSAALTFQDTCKETIDTQADKNYLMAKISMKMDNLSKLTSNSLALANRITGQTDDIFTKIPGRRLPEEKEFPRWLSTKDRKLLQSNTIKANAIVAKDGTGNYETISDAIQAATGDRFVIYVKSGVYNEKIHINKDGITLIGDGKYSSVISGDNSVAKGSSLQGTATVTITGSNFIARDIGFENTAGPQGKQAVALLIASDRSVLYKCSIAGYQDTLYAHSLRQFYRQCDIYGTIDFIFGNSASVFQSCNLVLRKPGTRGAYNVIMAQGRADPGQNTGFSVQNCRITVGSDFSPVKNSFESYLGRPWRAYSRSVVMQSTIDNAIAPRGWVEWSGNSFLKTLYFAEYENVGPGASTSNRVQWPGFHVIGREEALKFTVAKFISGTSWLPSTGATFDSGLQ